MIWILLGIVAVLAIVLCVLGAKTWYAWHVVLLFFVVMAGAGLMILAAMSLKTHQGWQSRYNQLKSEVESEQATIEQLTRGDILSDSDEMVSLPGVTGELGRALIDRGRVWRGVAPINIEGQAIALSMENWGHTRCSRVGIEDEDDVAFEPEPVAEGEDAAPAQSVQPHQIEKSMVLHVFQELSISEFDDATRAALFGNSDLVDNDTEGYCKLPSFYLGEYKVTDAAEDNVTIEPLSQLDASQSQAIQDAQGTTWVLYELLPLDSHEVFAGLSEEQLRSLIRADQTGLSPEDYDELIKEYLRDRQPADQGDPDTRTRTEVRFVRQHTIDVDVEQSEGGAERAYDLDGRAQLPHLRLGQAVEFNQGQQAYFDTEAAKSMAEEGTCELIEGTEVYDRSLHDYANIYHKTKSEMDRLAGEIETLQADSADIVAASEEAKTHIASRTAEIALLQSDRENFARDKDAVVKLLRDLKDERKKQKQRLSQYYQANREMERRLRQGQARLAPGDDAARPTR